MTFNRRGGRRPDRGPRRGPPDWQPREPRDARDTRDTREPRERDARDRDTRGAPDRGPFPPRRFERRDDEGGMSLRLDPRRLTAFKRLAAEVGVRPGELARIWIEERIDAERSGAPGGLAALSGIDELRARLDELVRRVAALESGGATPAQATEPASAAATPEPATDAPVDTADDARAEAAPTQRRSRRRRMTAAERNGDSGRVALHDEIIAVINERGASTAAEIAQAITERGRYMPPRSGKPLDAATVNGRVSNPVYRARFRREDGRIALAEPAAD